MNTKVVSSYKLDVEVRKRIKILAAEMEITAGELIEMLVEEYKKSKEEK